MTETAAGGITLHELQLAARNHGLPLEALRYPVTPAGLHYVLTHYDIPPVEPASWRLEVTGRVRHELTLSLEDLAARPLVRARVTMECAGNGRALIEPRPLSQPWLQEAVGTAEWGGAQLRPVLEAAGILEGATEVVFTGLDRGVEGDEEQQFARSLPLEEALRDELLLAYEMNGQPLPPQHGFPLRLVVPGWYGMTSVKWLGRITVTDEPFDGYQQLRGYRLRQDEAEEGQALTRIFPRALMVPPGIPEFLTRERLVDLAPYRIEGRAWSGWGPIASVEVSADGGATWDAAELGRQAEASAWVGWTYVWEPAAAGRYELACRARDAAGNEQPTAPPWNLGGYANNAVQRVAVTVRESG
jgi:DMSO/TMAO reductase YedYZ molybdopterin-dependent catalytic subunit